MVIKVGGTLLDDPDRRRSVAGQLALIAQSHQLVIVHGGGKQMTRFLEERGIVSKFVNGLRVSDEPVIDAASMIIAGSVNKQLVSALIAAGQRAFGISGVDGLLTPASRMHPELGWVGRAGETRGNLLAMLLDADLLPVVACIAGDDEGNIYNVNADQMAVSCAIAFEAEKLIFLTDVPGVKNAEGLVLPFLTTAEAAELIGSGVAHTGMQAKLEAATYALVHGVGGVTIAPGHQEHLAAKVLLGEHIGTHLSTVPVLAGDATA